MKKSRFDLSSSTLHLIGMAIMLLDHAWVTIAPSHDWLTWVGRIAFPIFAFLTAEGYRRTKNFKGYLGRMLLFAVLAEVPFNLMCSGGKAFYPLHQNVLFTFALALILMRCVDRVREMNKVGFTIFISGAVVLLGSLLGSFFMLDYYGAGVVTVLVFYFFRDRNIWNFLGQAACLYYINIELLGGLVVPVELFGYAFELPQQSLALLALIPIWLYRGRHGNSSILFRWLCYLFYPAHILLLVALQLLGVRL